MQLYHMLCTLSISWPWWALFGFKCLIISVMSLVDTFICWSRQNVVQWMHWLTKNTLKSQLALEDCLWTFFHEKGMYTINLFLGTFRVTTSNNNISIFEFNHGLAYLNIFLEVTCFLYLSQIHFCSWSTNLRLHSMYEVNVHVWSFIFPPYFVSVNNLAFIVASSFY